MIGTTVGNWRILSKLSVGGMGTVYRAEHQLIGKFAAVKVLHPELSSNRDIVNRFFNEAKATTSIKHPGIVEILDFGYMPAQHEFGLGDAYLVMEFLDGMSLARRLKTRGRMGEGDAAIMLRAVCSALAAAHAKGIVHRDLKPDNIFLIPDVEAAIGERPKLLDFGIAKLTEPGLANSNTKTGAVMGTPTYMSPEQCRGTGDVDHRADLYSLGCILYELVTGRPPFTNRGAGELIGAHIYAQPELPSLYQPGLSHETETLIMSLLDKLPANRPQTAKELGQRLLQIAERQGWVSPSTPSGITSESLRDLPVVAPSIVTTADSPHASAATPTAFSQEAEALAEKPTTLSLAASQSVIEARPRRRRWVGVAMFAAAALAGGSVAIFALGGGAERTGLAAAQVTTPSAEPAAASLPTPIPAAPAPAAAVAVPAVAPDAVVAVPAVVVTPPAVAAPEVVVEPKVARKAPGHPFAKRPKPAPAADKPKPAPTNSLIETDID